MTSGLSTAHIFAGLILLMGTTQAIPIPLTLADVGWQLGTAGALKSIEIFGDFQCPDTKAVWEGWLQTFRSRHADAASIIFHPFPLPYHKNGFDAAQAAVVMSQTLGASHFGQIGDALFAGQGAFQTSATVNVTQAGLFGKILAPIAVSVGVAKETFLSHMTNDDPSNAQSRVSWKLGASRGVSGTPTFAANGVISDELAGWTLSQWEAWFVAK